MKVTLCCQINQSIRLRERGKINQFVSTILSLNERTPTVVYASGSVHSAISIHGYVLRRAKRSRTDINAGYDGAE